MSNFRNHNQASETHKQAHSGPKRKKPPKSVQFILPPVANVRKDREERVWLDMLTSFHGMDLSAEILFAKLTNNETGISERVAPSVTLAINLNADTETLNGAILQARMLLSSQMSMRGTNVDPREYQKKLLTTMMGLFSQDRAKDVIKDALEELHAVHQAGLTPLNQAIWYRVTKAGVVRHSVIDLSKDPRPVRFQTMTDTRHGRKTPTQSRPPRIIQRTPKMSNRPEAKLLTHDTEVVGANETRQDLRTCENDSAGGESSSSIPGMPEDIIEFCVNGARWLDMNRYRSKGVAVEARNHGSAEPAEE